MIEIIEKALAENIRAKQVITIGQAEYEDEWRFEVVMTDETYDRHGEILRADGLDYSNFMKNPVVVADHEYEISEIIGKVTEIEFDSVGKRWLARGVFSKSNPKGVLAKDLYNEGMLRTVSVGLIPQYYENSETIKYWELLELSFVAVPANPNAMTTRKELLEEGIEAGLIVVQEDKEDETITIEAQDSIDEATTTTLNEILEEIKSLRKEFHTYKSATIVETVESDDLDTKIKLLAGQTARYLQIKNSQ